jgi:hypothetical protein
MNITEILQTIIYPLLRLVIALCAGLLLSQVVEALGLARHMARAANPLARFAHMGQCAAAAFALAFVSPSAANAMLSEHHKEGKISGRELMLANLLNSLPAVVVHLPTIFFMIWPVLGYPALIYIGLLLSSACLRTFLTACAARFILPRQKLNETPPVDPEGGTWRIALEQAFIRFKKRLPKLFLFSIPIYGLMVFLEKSGLLGSLENWMRQEAWFFVKPQALGIITLSLMAEISASLAAAGAIMQTGGLSEQDIILALIVGNIISTPMRALRHQLPTYAGYFSPMLALRLIAANQASRASSMCIVAWIYWVY